MISKGPVLDAANARVNRFMLRLVLFMLAYGLILPTNWQDVFGLAGWPIAWAADTAPATVKVSGVSPIPELVRGFFGLGSMAAILFAVLVAWGDPLAARVKYAFTHTSRSPWRQGAFLYLLFGPVLVGGLWLAYFLPIEIQSARGVTGGYKLLMLMISGRVPLAVLGAAAIVAVGVWLFALVVLLIGPILLAIKGDRS